MARVRLTICIPLAHLIRDDEELTLRYLYIGHGPSILITAPDHKHILIDAGPFDTARSTSDFLRERSVETIDTFIVTHPQPDHLSFAAEEPMMDLDVDVLQVAHHGVDSGTTAEFLNVSTPEVAVISCGVVYGIHQVPQPGVVSRSNGVLINTTMFSDMVAIIVNETVIPCDMFEM